MTIKRRTPTRACCGKRITEPHSLACVATGGPGVGKMYKRPKAQKKPTSHQARVLRALVFHGGSADPHRLGYPTQPLMQRLLDAGYLSLGTAPEYDKFNCIVTITDAGRTAASR